HPPRPTPFPYTTLFRSELEPRDTMIYLAREEFRLRKGQFDEAVADYSRAIQKDFQFPWTFARRARLRHQRKDLEKASKDIESARSEEHTSELQSRRDLV